MSVVYIISDYGKLNKFNRFSYLSVFINSNPKFNGKLIFAGSKNIFLRKKQYTLSGDESSALPIAKSIVLATKD